MSKSQRVEFLCSDLTEGLSLLTPEPNGHPWWFRVEICQTFLGCVLRPCFKSSSSFEYIKQVTARCPSPPSSFAMWPKSVKKRVRKTDSTQTKPPVLFNPANQAFFLLLLSQQSGSHIGRSSSQVLLYTASVYRCHDNAVGLWPSWAMQDTTNLLCRVQLNKKTFANMLIEVWISVVRADCQLTVMTEGSTVSQAGRLGLYAAFCLCRGKNVETGQANKSVNQTRGAHRGNGGESWAGDWSTSRRRFDSLPNPLLSFCAPGLEIKEMCCTQFEVNVVFHFDVTGSVHHLFLFPQRYIDFPAL